MKISIHCCVVCILFCVVACFEVVNIAYVSYYTVCDVGTWICCVLCTVASILCVLCMILNV